MPRDQLDASLVGLLESGLLLGRVEADDQDAVRLERDGLVKGGGAARDRADAVKHADIPADNLGGLAGGVYGAAHAAILQIVGHDGDDLTLGGLWTGGRPIP